MKCDVCQTNIPAGSNFCPNCGFQVRKTHENIFDISGEDHDHIQVKTVGDNTYDDNSYSNEYDSQYEEQPINTTKKISKGFKIGIAVALIIVIALFFIIPLIIGIVVINTEEDYYSLFEGMNFQEVYDAGYEDDSTLVNVMDYRDQIVKYLDIQDYSDIHVNEYCSKFSEEDDLRATLSINCKKNKINYYVDVTYTNGEAERSGLTLSGQLSSDIDRKQFYLKEEHIKDLADYLKIDNAYNVLRDSHEKMEKNPDAKNEYNYSNYNDMSIYMVEEYRDTSDPYWRFYYSIGTR